MENLNQKLKSTYKNFHKTIIIFRVIEDFIYLLASYTLIPSVFYIHVAIFIVSLIIYFYITNVEYNIKRMTSIGLSIIIVGTFIRSLFLFKYTLWINTPYLLCILALPVFYSKKEIIFISIAVITCIVAPPLIVDYRILQIPSLNYSETLRINDYIAMIASIILILFSLKFNIKTINLKNEIEKTIRAGNTVEMRQTSQNSIPVINVPKHSLNGEQIDDKSREICLQITEYFDEKKPYLDATFNMQILASAIESNLNYVSKTMNLMDQGGFIGFVNKYRIKYIMDQVNNGNYKEFTLETIYKNAGFSHQSTFNRVFKQHLQQSPRDYIKDFEKKNKNLNVHS